MPTQNELILQHLRHGHTITSREAMMEYGITRLAARIYDLRQAGYPIADRTVEVPTRHGKNATVSEYFLPQGQQQLEL